MVDWWMDQLVAWFAGSITEWMDILLAIMGGSVLLVPDVTTVAQVGLVPQQMVASSLSATSSGSLPEPRSGWPMRRCRASTPQTALEAEMSESSGKTAAGAHQA